MLFDCKRWYIGGNVLQCNKWETCGLIEPWPTSCSKVQNDSYMCYVLPVTGVTVHCVLLCGNAHRKYFGISWWMCMSYFYTPCWPLIKQNSVAIIKVWLHFATKSTLFNLIKFCFCLFVMVKHRLVTYYEGDWWLSDFHLAPNQSCKIRASALVSQTTQIYTS